ncbi:MAG: DUF3783 domain-containing protein [Anaerotardibacter sp.]
MATKKKTKKKVTRPSFSVCLWGLDETTQKGEALRALFKEMGIPVRTIKEEQLGDAVGSVAGLIGFRPSYKPFEGQAALEEFILFNNVPSKNIQAFLTLSKERDCQVAHKAIITKFNKTWPLHELMVQIAQEHAQLTGNNSAEGSSSEEAADTAE